jgi:polysaccharide biosynthesis protein PslL
MKDRNKIIDVVKGIGILLVVFGHNWITLHGDREIFRVIFSFHMPLFFFLSGIFLKESTPFRVFLKSRTDTLLKPYFVVLAALGTIQLLWAIIKSSVTTQKLYYFVGLVYGTGKTISWAPFWFLPHLFISSFFALIVLTIIKRRAWITFISIIMLSIGIHFIDAFYRPDLTNIGSISINNLPGLPWSLDLIPITSSLIIFGYLLRDWVKKMTFSPIGFLLATIVFSCLHYYFDETIDLNERIYGNALISTLQAAIGTYLTISIAAIIQNYSRLQKPLAYIGSGTLFILMFHDTIQVNTFEMLSKFSEHQYINAILSFCMGVIFPLIIWEIIKRMRLGRILLLPQQINSYTNNIRQV